MGEIDTNFLAKERLLMNILSKYGPVLNSIETSDVINCPRPHLHDIPMTELPRLIKYGGVSGVRYFALDIVNYLIPGGIKKLSNDFVYNHLFEHYGAVIKTRELVQIMRGNKLETYNIPEKDLPILPRLENGALRYMLHDVVGYMTSKMFASERPEMPEGHKPRGRPKTVKVGNGDGHVQP